MALTNEPAGLNKNKSNNDTIDKAILATNISKNPNDV